MFIATRVLVFSYTSCPKKCGKNTQLLWIVINFSCNSHLQCYLHTFELHIMRNVLESLYNLNVIIVTWITLLVLLRSKSQMMLFQMYMINFVTPDLNVAAIVHSNVNRCLYFCPFDSGCEISHVDKYALYM